MDGELYSDSLSGSPPELSLDSAQRNLAGTDNGGRLTLLDDFGNTIFGSLDRHALDLDIPQSTGALKTVDLHQASINTYNGVLSQWQTTVSAANTAGNDINNVLSAITTAPMGNSSGIANHEQDLGSDIENVYGVQSTIEDRLFPRCPSIMSAYNYADAAYPDAVSLVSEAKSQLAPDLGAVRQAVGHARAAWAAFWRTQSALPRYPFNPIPPLTTVLARAQNLVLSTVSYVNSDIDKANNFVAQAYGIVNTANETHHCGPLQGVPALNHISLNWLLSNSTVNQVLTPSLAQYNERLSDWHRWASAATVVAGDIVALQNPNYLPYEKGSFAAGLGTVQLNLNHVTSDKLAWPPPCEARGTCPGLTCSYIATAKTDAQTVFAASRSMVANAESILVYKFDLVADVRALQKATSAASADWATYWQARKLFPRYGTANPPPPLTVALAASQTTITSLLSEANSYIDKANLDVAQAYGIVNTADASYKCGPPEAVPALQQLAVPFILSS